MKNHKRLRGLLFLGMAIVAIVILSTGLSELELLPGQSFSVERESQDQIEGFEPSPSGQVLVALLRGFILLTLLLMPFAVVYMIVSPQFRKQVLRRLLSFLVLAVTAYLLARRWLELFGMEEEAAFLGVSVPAGLPFPTTPVEFVADPPAWLVLATTLGLALLLSALLVGGVWFLRRRNRRRMRPLEQLAQEAEEALELLRAGSDLKDTVMRCYAEMAYTLDRERGISRQRSMTPREFEGRLEEVGLPGEPVQRLTRLFEKVRYGAKIAGEHEEEQAIACLVAIVQACRASM